MTDSSLWKDVNNKYFLKAFIFFPCFDSHN